MRRVGIFLGVEPINGGMFHYAESVLEALCALPVGEFRVVAAYVAPLWGPILDRHRCEAVHLRAGRIGMRLANLAMAAGLPAVTTRRLAGLSNPIVIQLARLGCDAWLFPAQDSVGYQVEETVVVSVHDLMHRYEPHFPEVSSQGRRAIRDHRFQSLADHAAAVLVDSEVGRQQVVESYGTDPGKVYPLPYVAPRQVVAAEVPPDLEGRYALPAKFLLYPAQFWPHKNHGRLVEALATLVATHPDLHLVCAGGKNHGYEAVEARVKALGLGGHVTFTGYVADADLKGLYLRARGLVFPTFFGPTNIPPLEAFACGCPVAVSWIYGMPEQVGDAAILFDPSSIPSIAEAMARLWDDDALVESLRERGRAHALAWGQAEFNQRLQVILQEVWRRGRARARASHTGR